MKRLLTLAIALVIASVAFGQTKDYKHPLTKKKKKEVVEKFPSQDLIEARDYKHPITNTPVKRVFIRQGSGANSAASTKHPFN
ncbi:MAG: hypothetical protein WDO15_26735 [Bacteroidota bacterium]